jgi:hypothetical protein
MNDSEGHMGEPTEWRLAHRTISDRTSFRAHTTGPRLWPVPCFPRPAVELLRPNRASQWGVVVTDALALAVGLQCSSAKPGIGETAPLTGIAGADRGT